MNEEELINDFDEFIKKWCKENYVGHLLDNDDNDGEDFRDKLRGLFQKGKLEQKKEELRFLLNIQNWFDTATGQAYEVNERIKQLQKEIGGKK